MVSFFDIIFLTKNPLKINRIAHFILNFLFIVLPVPGDMSGDRL